MLLKQFTKLFADFSYYNYQAPTKQFKTIAIADLQMIKRYSRLPFTPNEWEYLDYQTDDRSLKSILQIFDR